MVASAAATAGYAWLVGPLLRSFDWDSGATKTSPVTSDAALSMTQIVALLVLLGLVRALAETARTRLSAALQLGVVREFRGKVLSHVLRLEPSILLGWPPGELASRIQVEVHGVRALLHLGVSQGIRSILVATALASVALRVDTALAIPGLLVVPLAVVLVVLAARPARRLQRALYSAESIVVSDTAEAVDGAAVLQAYGAITPTWRRIDQQAADAARQGVATETWGATAAPMVELAGAVSIALVFAFAWSRGGAADLADTGTVLVALLLMYRPLHGLAQALFGWWSGLASLDRLDELLRLDATPLARPAVRGGHVESLFVEGLDFDYGAGPVLEAAGVSLRGGELVVITGPSGAGKSTWLGLLAGVLRPDSGEIAIDGKSVAREALREAAAWMPQSPSLFHDTILRNVALGDTDPDRTRVIEACRRVDAHDFISSRPQGYEGVLREGGTDLSMGQRQRVALARALYRDAPVLLLDEPTSALDEALERNVIGICRARADRGDLVVVATHRRVFLQAADRVLEVREGTLIEWERHAAGSLLH
jgi:ABC-type multidrug transport system fused ATPase/permease subunit